MAVGMCILSKRQRYNLSMIFIILNIFQIIIGCGMTGSSLYIIIAVAPILHQEKSEINFVFVVTSLYGTHVIFHWIVGINISQRCLKNAGKKSTSNLFLLWSCLGTGTILQLLILSHFARKMNKYISKSIKHSITTGMSQYLQDISWKETIDKLQYSNECCGLTSFENWHGTKWLNKYHVDVKSSVVKQFSSNDEILTLPVVPWSCCKLDFPMQCLHDPLQQSEYTHLWVDEPTFVTDSINTKGCLNLIKKPITWTINIFVMFGSFLCIGHVVIFVISRLLYTSSRNAILLGEPDGMAPGWIFGRGDCGYTGGKSVIEIMENQPRTLEFTEDESEKTDKTFRQRFFKKKHTVYKGQEKSKEINNIDKNEESLVKTENGLITEMKDITEKTKLITVNEKQSGTTETSIKTNSNNEKSKVNTEDQNKKTNFTQSSKRPSPPKRKPKTNVSNKKPTIIDTKSEKADALKDKDGINNSPKVTSLPKNDKGKKTQNTLNEKVKKLQQ